MQPEDICGLLIKQIHDALEKSANNSLRSKDLTSTQMHLLFILRESADGEYPLKEIEKRLRVSQPTAAGIVRRLEQKGFVEGRVSCEDKRIKLARITSRGLSMCIEAEDDMIHAEKNLVSSLTDVEKLQFLMLLRKVCATVK